MERVPTGNPLSSIGIHSRVYQGVIWSVTGDKEEEEEGRGGWGDGRSAKWKEPMEEEDVGRRGRRWRREKERG